MAERGICVHFLPSRRQWCCCTMIGIWPATAAPRGDADHRAAEPGSLLASRCHGQGCEGACPSFRLRRHSWVSGPGGASSPAPVSSGFLHRRGDMTGSGFIPQLKRLAEGPRWDTSMPAHLRGCRARYLSDFGLRHGREPQAYYPEETGILVDIRAIMIPWP